ncbi:MAG: glycoside hydrolase family 2 [Pedobacter sp.]|nr:glycoside hydrolase family 2 [Pedobacter sp.]
MKILNLLVGSLILLSQVNAQTRSKTMNFDKNWRFHAGGMLGAAAPTLDDEKWRQLDLPHDWSIEDRPGTTSPFDPNAISQVNEGFTTQGTAWYRKKFNMPAAAKGERVIIQFDGVYMNSDVFLNGKPLGNHPYGYTSFYYDLTDNLNFGGENVLAVEVKNEGANSRWYSGSGIYRHVWLKTIPAVHLAQWGTFISTPKISGNSATIQVKNKLINESKSSASIRVVTHFLKAEGAEVGKTESNITLEAGDQKEISGTTGLKAAELWTLEKPHLYRAITEVYQDGKLIQQEENTFGIRSISFDVERGFELNGKALKLKGGCIHNDNGPLGAVAYDRAEERKVELLKASGFNAIRCSHNPPSPAFLDACDRLGMLVIDESFDMWNIGKNPYDYHLYFKDWWQKDIESMVTRDRNHPSIILWSIGNEIPERGTAAGVETAKSLKDYVKSLDPTRSVTAAVNDLKPDKDPFFNVLDVGGYNYGSGGDHLVADIFAKDHERVPGRIMVGTESYAFEAFDSWMAVIDHPYLVGDFVWTAFDYIGEASIGWLGYWQKADFYPWNLAFCGDLDICGWKRPQSYYRDALWKKDQLSVFVTPPKPSFPQTNQTESWSKWNWHDVVPEWNWEGNENKPMEVSVYSSCESVELFLNGKSLGPKQKTDRSTKFIAKWTVPYAAGELKAVGYSGNKKINTAVLQSAGNPTQIKLSPDRKLKAGENDLSYITVELTDAKGVRNPTAANQVKFEISGDAKIVGVGNSNPVSLESFQLPQRKAWKGRCLVVVKGGAGSGPVTLKATVAGLPAASVSL